MTLPGQPAARSMNHHRIRRIAPHELIDRSVELAALAAFCTGSGGAAYRWLRADAWAGKSALVSWFALHPPPGVRVVSFFATARWAGQSGRAACIEVVVEQFADLLGEPVGFVIDTTRDAYLLDLWERAATRCRDHGERLVVVVDGLAEDGVAALLPVVPPADSRVVVTGRSDPPVPADHPLSDPAAVQVLAPSPTARSVRRARERELAKLLHGDEPARELLGLLVAAGGGLTARDLVELTGHTPETVDAHVSPIARAGRGEQLALAHDDLHAQAAETVGPDLVDRYRKRLHDWAGGYRDRGWPIDTPEYLLRGYFRLLVATGDIARMLSCVTDPNRRDRLLALTPDGTATFAEIAATQAAVVAHDPPDLAALARIAVHRDEFLLRHNEKKIEHAPVVWAKVGDRGTATNKARRFRYSDALLDLARHAATVGNVGWARDLAIEAETRTRRDGLRRRQLVNIAAVAAACGEPDRVRALLADARAAAPTDADPDGRVRALCRMAVVAGTAALHDLAAELLAEAERVARAVTRTDIQAYVLAGIVTEGTEGTATGDRSRWAGLAADAEALLPAITREGFRPQAVERVAVAYAVAGVLEKATEVAGREPDPKRRRYTVAAVARAAARAGHLPWAIASARAIETPNIWADLLADLAEIDPVEGRHLVVEAERAARTVSNPNLRRHTLARVGRAAARVGNVDQAEKFARGLDDVFLRAGALVYAAEAAADTRQDERARALLTEAEESARAIVAPSERESRLAFVTTVATRAGDLDVAETLCARVPNGSERLPGLLLTLAEAFAGTGDRPRMGAALKRAGTAVRSIRYPLQRARARAGGSRTMMRLGYVEQAIRTAGTITEPNERLDALAAVAEEAAAGGRFDTAVRLARDCTQPYLVARTLARVASRVAAAGEITRAQALRVEAVTVARTGQASFQPRFLLDLARAATGPGAVQHVETLVSLTTNTVTGDDVLVEYARVLSANGAHDRAVEAAELLSDNRSRARALIAVARAGSDPERVGPLLDRAVELADRDEIRAAAAELAATAGDLDRAELLVRTLRDPDRHFRVLTAVLTVAVRTGDMGRTTALARLSSATMSLLAGAAGYLPREQGRRLLARVLCATSWTACLVPLRMLHRDALTVIAAEYTALIDRRLSTDQPSKNR